MKTNVQELIKVSYVGPYGPKIGDVYYRLGKKVSVNMFQVGHTYSVQVGTGKEGAKFINSIDKDLGNLEAGTEAPPVLNPALNQAAPVSAPAVDNRPRRAGFDKPLTDYDMRIQMQISLAGLLQAAMPAVASHVSGVDKLIAESQRVAEAQIAWVTAKVTELLTH